MATYDATRSYRDGEVLVAGDFDVFLDELEELVNVTGLDDDNIQPGGITASSKFVASSVTTAKFEAGSVTAAKITDGVITQTKLAAGAVTSGKIAASIITYDKLADGAITQAKVATNAVVTAGIADSTLEAGKFEQITNTSSTATATSSTSSWLDIASVSIAVTGNRPVIVMCVYSISSGSFTASSSSITGGLFDYTQTGSIKISENSRVVADINFSSFGQTSTSTAQNTIRIPSSSIFTIDTAPPAGTITYTLSIMGSSSGGDSTIANGVQLRAYEL